MVEPVNYVTRQGLYFKDRLAAEMSESEADLIEYLETASVTDEDIAKILELVEARPDLFSRFAEASR